MPFVAERDGERVVPTQVEDGARCTCPTCGNELGVKRAHHQPKRNAFVARHFFHLVETDCPGESDEHLRMKAIAHSKLEERYPDAEVDFEEKVEGSGRRADVLVTFGSPRYPFGDGIAVEVQYMNKQKDIETVERDYLNQSHSVLWLYEDDFSGRDVHIERDKFVSVFPNAVPITEPEDYYPDYPKTTGHEETISLLPSPSEFRKEIAEGWLTGKRKRILKKIDGNFPEENGGWQNGITRVRTTSGGEMSLSMTPDGGYVIKIDEGSDEVRLGLSAVQSSLFYKNAKTLCVTDIEGIIEEVRGGPGEWVNAMDGRFKSGPATTSWINPSVSPIGLLMISAGKKKYRDSEAVNIRISDEDVPNLLHFFMEVSVLLENL